MWRDKNIWWIRCFSLSCLRHLRYAHTLIMVGANVYSHTASAMNENYEKRIDISYITEKIKQWDEQNSISIGTFHNKTVLIHTEMTAGKKYYTYIYQENGALRELMIRDGLDTKKVQGEEIVPVKGFEIKEQNQMYDIRITGEDGVNIEPVYTDRAENRRAYETKKQRKPFDFDGIDVCFVFLCSLWRSSFAGICKIT